MAMDKLNKDIVEAFNDSLERCGQASDFLGEFYQRFTASSPEIAQRFANTDLKVQTRVLKSSFYMAMLAFDQEPEALSYLDRIAERHNRAGLDIKPEFYDQWLECMVATVSESDPCFDDDIEKVWRSFLQPAIAFMKSHY